MTQPPEWTEHRTETQRLGDDIATAARNLRRDWPHMLRDGDTQPPGAASTSGVQLDDHDPRGTDQRRIDRTISLRRYVVDVLNSWSRVVIEDRGVKKPAVRCRHGIDVWVTMRFPSVGPLPKPVPRCRRGRPLIGNTHVVRGSDVDDLLDFMETNADWMGGHETAQDCRDEIVELAKQCHLVAFPPRRDSMSLGQCPLEVPGEQDVLEPCRGDVRARTGDEHHIDGKVWAACNRCGEVSPAEWWAERMFLDGEASPLVTIGELIAVIAYRLGVTVTHEQIRQWKHREKIHDAGRDHKGRLLFRHEDVIDSIRADVRKRAVKL